MQGAIHQGTQQQSDDARQMMRGEVSPAAGASESEANRKAENEEMSPESPETERRSSTNGNEDTQSSSCVIINVDMENSVCECADGDGSSILSSKTCSVEDISLTGVQEEAKSFTPNEGCEGKVTSEVRSDALLEKVNREPESVGREEGIAAGSAEAPKLSGQSSSVIIEEEEGTAGLHQAESQDYINPRGVRFMSQETGQDGEYIAFPLLCQVLTEVVRFLVVMVVAMKNGVFCDVTLCGSCKN
jgi:hypothetical protein